MTCHHKALTALNHTVNQTGGWSSVVRFVVCGMAALLNAVDMGLQGNGNLIWSGVILGFTLGLAWSVFLLFVLPSFGRRFRPELRASLWAVSLLAVVVLFVVMCFQIW